MNYSGKPAFLKILFKNNVLLRYFFGQYPHFPRIFLFFEENETKFILLCISANHLPLLCCLKSLIEKGGSEMTVCNVAIMKEVI
ncbi:MAG: hypothetical protein VW602_13090, partial [Paracoccaceae bacterium]